MYNKFLTVLLPLLVIEIKSDKSKNCIVYENFDWKFNKEFGDGNFVYKQGAHPYINIDINIKQVVHSVSLQFNLSASKNNKKSFKILDLTLNICEFTLNPKGDFLTMLAFKALEKSGNLTSLRCPFKPGYYYSHNISTCGYPDYFPATKLMSYYMFYAISKNNIKRSLLEGISIGKIVKL